VSRLGQEKAITFRFAASRDVDDVVGLVQSAYRGDTSRQGWTTEADLLEGQRTDMAAVREIIEHADSVLLLALRNGSLVGSCQLVCREHGESAYFGMFAIRPGLQGIGLGSAVLAEAERVARERWGARSLRMTVIRQREELIDWYRRRGFESTGETEPFPYGDERYGVPLRNDLEFIVLDKRIDLAPPDSGTA
jgi:ribosomal protein S18 acetylase RimI-like enzyme